MVVIYICDDNMLMEQTKNGDTKAFEQLVLRHREKAIGFAFSFLTDAYMAEDIVQERLKYSAKLLNSLKADYRTAFCLYEIYGFSYKEIAEIMDKSLPQIKIILYRARNKLQKYAEEDMQNEK